MVGRLIHSVVQLHIVARVGVHLLRRRGHANVSDLGDASLPGDIGVSKEVSSRDDSSDDTEPEGSLHELDPVEVVVPPEVLEVNSLLDDSLLSGGVESAAVDDGHLEVLRGRVSVTERGLVELVPSSVGEVILDIVTVWLSSVAVEEFLVGFVDGLFEI